MHVQERIKPIYFSTWYIDCDNLISRGVGYVAEISNDEIIPPKIKSFIEILFYN